MARRAARVSTQVIRMSTMPSVFSVKSLVEAHHFKPQKRFNRLAMTRDFVQADLRLGERLSHTVGGRDTIAIDEDDVQPWLSLGNDRLVDVGQAAGKRAASPTTPHHCDTGSRTPMVQLVVQVVATGLLTRLYLLRRRSLCLLTIVIVNLDPIFSSANSIFSTRA